MLIGVATLVLALPAHALASSSQESILMDDQELIYSSPAHVTQTLERLRGLGVDRVKVSMVWSLVSPNPTSTQRPNFDPSNPSAYPPGAWDRYDLIVRLAQQIGIGVYFQLTAPAPPWAVSTQTPTQGYSWSHRPSPRLFGQFVTAVARRYSGSWVATVPAQQPRPGFLGLPLTLPGTPAPAAPGQPAPIPRVNYWGIWNEPNEGAWLNPQYRTSGGTRILLAPGLYRGLVDAAWRALASTGHARDTILIGETASGGIIRPFPFIRALYCVDSSYRPLTGVAAKQLSCPASGRGFAAAHPGLFAVAGYAHHPYSFGQPPSQPFSDPDMVTLANLGKFEGSLGRIFSVYRQPGAGLPMYLTEWGYKTNPPNPYEHISLSQQAAYLNQGEYMAWRDPHVRALAQFLLVDSRPRTSARRGTRAYWGTFQTGLLYVDGAAKPAYGSFRIPIWLPDARHSRRVTIWGELRPANHAGLQYGVIDYRQGARGAWSALRDIQTANSEGFLLAHVALPNAGAVRLGWLQPGTGRIYYSRTVAVS
jgi:hypothetical protein